MKKFLAIALVCTSCYISEELPPDQQVWTYDLPKNQGFDQSLLLFLNRRIQEQEFGAVEGLTIIKDDHLIFENYYLNGANRQSTKNIGGTGVLISLAALAVAIDERQISVEDSIYRFLPEYAEVFQQNPDKRNIRVIDLLTHRTGLAWNENIERDPSMNNLFQMKQQSDWVEFVLSQTLVGVGFYSYNTANGLLLAKVLENATGTDFNLYLQDEIFSPLGISQTMIEQDPQGNYNGGDGYSLSLLDYTKIGYLFLNEGIWQDRTLLNSDFIKDAMTRQYQFSQTVIENSIGYFWIFFGSELQNLGVEPENVVYLVGEVGQAIFVVPEEEMIVSVYSENPFGFNFAPINLFFEITRAKTSSL